MKTYSDRQHIELLISEGEHQQQDFKFEISSARKIAKSISAFANTRGGRLLIGVKDNGTLAGIRSEEELYMIEAAATTFSKPKVSIQFEEFHIDGKTILIANIPEAKEKPVYAKDETGKYWAYVRIDDENIQANAVQIKVWKDRYKEWGEFISYSIQEELLFKCLENGTPQTISQITKSVYLSRKVVINLLAKFIAFELIESIFEDRQFKYRLL